MFSTYHNNIQNMSLPSNILKPLILCIIVFIDIRYTDNISVTAKTLSRKHVVNCASEGRENSMIDNMFVTVPNVRVIGGKINPIMCADCNDEVIL